MALPNYDRFLFVAQADTIANSPSLTNTLNSYLTTNGFNGVYLADGDFASNAANLNTLIGTINTEVVGAIGGSSASAAIVNDYNTAQSNDVDAFVMYNDFWNIGDNAINWLTEFDGVTDGIPASYWILNYQNTSSTDIRSSGYTETEFAEQQIDYLFKNSPPGNNKRVGVLLSAFEQGQPRYFTSANDKTSTNIFYKMDILAEAIKNYKLVNLQQQVAGTNYLPDTGYTFNPVLWDSGGFWFGTSSVQSSGLYTEEQNVGGYNDVFWWATSPATPPNPSAASTPVYYYIETGEIPVGQTGQLQVGFSNGGYPPANCRVTIPNPQANTVYEGTATFVFPTSFAYAMVRYTNNGPLTNGRQFRVVKYNMLLENPSFQSLKVPVHIYVHVGQVDFGGSQDFSGFSLQAAGTYDAFEKKLLKSIVDRMTKFQKEHLDIKGFVYYKYPYAQAAINSPDCISSLSSVPGNTSAYVSWTAGSGGTPTSYDVYVSTNSNPSASVSPINVSSNSITVTGLSASTTYYIAVISKNAVGDSSGCSTYTFTTTSTPTPPPVSIGNYRTMYVESSTGIVGNATKENDLLSYAQSLGINSLHIYGGWDMSSATLATFISKSRGPYGIEKVNCVVNGRYSADRAIAYNDSRVNSIEKWTGMTVENEFWRGHGWTESTKCVVIVQSAVSGHDYTIKVNGVNHTITAASSNTSAVATQLYNKLVTDLGGTDFYNTIGFKLSGNEIRIARTGSVIWDVTPAPVTDSTNVFTSGSLPSVSSSYNPDKISCPIYVEVAYDGTIVSGDRSPNNWGVDNPNYDDSKIVINDTGTGSPTLVLLSFLKYLKSESINRSNEWDVVLYATNYGSYNNSSNIWRLTEAKYIAEYVDIYQATNYVSSVGFNSALQSKLYYLADAVRVYGGGFGVPKYSQSFVPLWSAESAYYGSTVLPSYKTNFYPNMSGGLDQLESDWSASYATGAPATSRSYLDFKGSGYFEYKYMQNPTFGAVYSYP